MHMLGYLGAEKWVDIIKNYPEYNKNEIWEILKEVDEYYSMDMTEEVKGLLEDNKHDI